MHLYIASSWRNTYYPEVVQALQAAGHFLAHVIFFVVPLQPILKNYQFLIISFW